MIRFILIKNIVLIETLKIDFENGLTVFSGETGAGKSILLNCLGLATGRRSEIGFLRKGAYEGSVTVEFDVKDKLFLKKELNNHGIIIENDQVFLRRVLYKDGKSKAFISDTPVSIGLLKKIGSDLIEIHGQNEKIGLLDTASHLKLLDKYGNHSDLLLEIKNKYDNFTHLSKIYSEAKELSDNKKKYEDELKNNINIIKKLNIKENEEKNLKSKKNFLSQHEKIFNVINKIYLLLNDENNSLTNDLSGNSVKLENLIDKNNEVKELNQINHSVNQILIEAKEVVNNIRAIRENYHFDQKELEEIEQRLFDINNLARKFDVEPSYLTMTLKDFENNFNNLKNDSQKIDEIYQKLEKAQKKFQDACETLSLKRELASKKLENDINNELNPLRLINARFKVDISAKEKKNWNMNGSELVRFLVRLNKGVEEAEIHKVSSGGELSRLMLAINLVLAKNISPKTLVFDEVDSGVSGAVAESVGTRLLELSKFQQVLVVTHLPQVASRGNSHYKSFKFYNRTETFTGIEKLNKEKRIEEIAKMISGEEITNEAIEVAKQLLNEN